MNVVPNGDLKKNLVMRLIVDRAELFASDCLGLGSANILGGMQHLLSWTVCVDYVSDSHMVSEMFESSRSLRVDHFSVAFSTTPFPVFN